MNKKENPIREGKPIMVIRTTHERLTKAKIALKKETFDALLNWLLEQVGL